MSLAAERPSNAALGYTLSVLVVVYTLNFIDRQIFSILLPSIQAEFELSDLMGGLLHSTTFALFYATLGVPIAWLADRSNRRNLIAYAIALWSAMTALCGLAPNVWLLALARMGVGVGEAGCSPPAHSLIADYFPAERRATALSIYSLGIPFGIMFGLFFGGWLDEMFGWRKALLLVGVPGIAVALIVRFTLREPRRGQSDPNAALTPPPSLAVTARYLAERRAFVHLTIGTALAAFAGYSVVTWLPAFLVRSHAMASSDIGVALGLIVGIAGGAGIFLGGYLADRCGSRDVRWRLWLVPCAFVLSAPLYVATFLATDSNVALVCLTLPMLLTNAYQATSFAQTQNLAAIPMRSTAAAILFLIINLVGLGMGPPLTGWVSDLLATRYGADSLRYALAGLIGVYLWSGWHYYLAGRHLPGDLPRA